MSQPEKVRARLHAIDERLARLRAEKDRLVACPGRTIARCSTWPRVSRRERWLGGASPARLWPLRKAERESPESGGARWNGSSIGNRMSRQAATPAAAAGAFTLRFARARTAEGPARGGYSTTFPAAGRTTSR